MPRHADARADIYAAAAFFGREREARYAHDAAF